MWPNGRSSYHSRQTAYICAELTSLALSNSHNNNESHLRIVIALRARIKLTQQARKISFIALHNRSLKRKILYNRNLFCFKIRYLLFSAAILSRLIQYQLPQE